MSSERQEHNENNPWWGEHIHRYQIALQNIPAGSTVLDIACGNGFGSTMLCEKAGKVIGGDISTETINYCRSAFPSEKNLEFNVIDGTQTGFQDEFVDSVVSFETIEHTTKYKEMVGEFARITKKGGTVFISTPNRSVSSPDGIIVNPYHTQEFTYAELLTLLTSIFDSVSFYGQQYIRYKKKSFRNSIGYVIETLLYLRGIRKLPIAIQDRIMRMIIGKPMYPLPADFEMTTDKQELLHCKTFFVICKKNG